MTYQKHVRVGSAIEFRSRTRGLSLLAAFGMAVCPWLAPGAAETGAAATAKDDEGLAEIVVTADKRQESVSSAPVAVSVFDQATMTEKGVLAVKDLDSYVPNFQVSTTGFATSVELTIRGIAGNGVFEDNDPSVGVFVDGVYVPRFQALNAGLYDLSRVEVLRGPQGTLYGKNTIAGSMNIETQAPTQTFGGHVDASYGNYDDGAFHAVLNVPLSDTFAVRGSLYAHRNRGYIDMENSPRNYEITDEIGGRLAYLWTPTTSFTWRVTGEGYRNNGTPTYGLDVAQIGKYPIDGAHPLCETGNPLSSATTPCLNPRSDVKVNAIRSRMDWQIAGPVSLAYIAGYQSLQYDSVQDTDGTPQYILNTFENQHNDNHYQELNLSFTTDQVKAIVGGSYFHEKNRNFAGISTSAFAAFPSTPQGTDLIFFVPDTTATSYGAFSQLTYSLTDRLHLTGGLRYSHDEKDKNNKFVVSCPVDTPIAPYVLPPGCTESGVSGHGVWSKTSWKVGADFNLTDQTLLYGSVATGYKAGGISDLPPGAPNQQYQPETNVNYEVGLKTHSSHVRYGLALFDIAYKDLQIAQYTSTGGVVTTNAAAARIYGAEFESTFKPFAADTIGGFLTFLHATYTDYRNAADPAGIYPVEDLTGHDLPKTPHFTARVEYAHEFPVSDHGVLTPSAAVFYKSRFYLLQWNQPTDTVGGYAQTDLRLTYKDARQWNLEAYVQNLEDKEVQNTQYCLVGHCYAYFNLPRTLGVRYTHDF